LGVTVEGNYSGTTEIIKPTAFTTTGLVNGETLTALSKFKVQYREVSRNDDNYVTELVSAGGTAVLSNYILTQAPSKLAGDTQNMVKIKALSDVIVDLPKWQAQAAPAVGISVPAMAPVAAVPAPAPVPVASPSVTAAPVPAIAAAPTGASTAAASATVDGSSPRSEESTATSAQAAAPRPTAGPSAGVQRAADTSPGVTVAVVNAPTAQTAGLVNVVVPQAAVRGTAMLVVALPESVTRPAAADVTVNATLPDDRPLPNWIKYDPGQRALLVESTPATSLPITVILNVGGQRTNVVVSESGAVGR
jgi:hypothetical protein